MASHSSGAVLTAFEASLERCLAAPDFIDRFYRHFVERSEEAAAKFQDTDMARQARMLRHSLYMMLRAAQGHDTGLEHLEQVAATHSKGGHDIPPHLYEHWVTSLMEAVAEVDPHFDAQVEEAWRKGLAPAIEVMTRRYDR